MKTKHIARWMGILYLVGTLAGILSRVLTAPFLSTEDTLGYLTLNGSLVTLAALMVMGMGMALAAIPVVAYPVLKKQNEILALGYLVFRGALEGATYLGIAVSWLLLLPLSQIAQLGGMDAVSAKLLARTLLETPELGAVLMVVFSLGGFMLYTLLYQSRLVPRWLSLWGLLAILMNFAAGLLILFGIFGPVSSTSTIMQLPIFLQEITLAIWLIVKGFREI